MINDLFLGQKSKLTNQKACAAVKKRKRNANDMANGEQISNNGRTGELGGRAFTKTLKC